MGGGGPQADGRRAPLQRGRRFRVGIGLPIEQAFASEPVRQRLGQLEDSRRLFRNQEALLPVNLDAGILGRLVTHRGKPAGQVFADADGVGPGRAGTRAICGWVGGSDQKVGLPLVATGSSR
jgi:hypothetical protein